MVETNSDTIHCAQCGTRLEPVKASAIYLKFRFDIEIPGCPVCGRVYVSEELALTKVAELEALLEQK